MANYLIKLIGISEAAEKCSSTPETLERILKEKGVRIYTKTNTLPNSMELKFIKKNEFEISFPLCQEKPKADKKKGNKVNLTGKSLLENLKEEYQNKLAQFKTI